MASGPPERSRLLQKRPSVDVDKREKGETVKKKWKILLYILVSLLLLIAALIVFHIPILERLLVRQMSKKCIPGVGITLIKKYEIQWSKSYGVIKKGTAIPISSETLFQAASATKLCVAAAALHFVEKGMIELDRNINDYLKSWRLPDNEYTIEKKVTLRMLLSHQSGLPETDLPYRDGTSPSLVQVLNGESPALNRPAKVEYTPGSRWLYSNIAYALIQLLIEDITGQSLEKTMRDVVFSPLKMNSSTLIHPLTVEFSHKKEASPHNASGKAYPADLHPTAQAQGGLLSTPSDLAKLVIELMRAYQGESNLIISKKTAQLMFRAGIQLDAQNFGGIQPYQGLGVFIVKGKKFYILSVGNNTPGSTCWVLGIPELGGGAVVMTNGQQGFDLTPKIIGALLIVNRWPMPDL